MWHDIQVAVRGFRKSPGFTITALVTLTLAIGANTTVFSLLNALVLRDANVRDPRSLVQVSSLTPPDALESGLTYAMYDDFKHRQQVFSSVLGWRSNGVYNLDADGRQSRGLVAAVSGNFFEELGARPRRDGCYRSPTSMSRPRTRRWWPCSGMGSGTVRLHPTRA